MGPTCFTHLSKAYAAKPFAQYQYSCSFPYPIHTLIHAHNLTDPVYCCSPIHLHFIYIICNPYNWDNATLLKQEINRKTCPRTCKCQALIFVIAYLILYGLLMFELTSFQRTQNFELVTCTHKRDHISPILHDLHHHFAWFAWFASASD